MTDQRSQPDVSIVAMDEYTPSEAERALLEALAPFGGLDWVTPGMRVAVKVNLLGAHKPEAAATTHPVLVTALCRMLAARGASVVVGDSPGGLFSKAYLAPIYRVCGMRAVEAAGASLNDDFSETDVDNPGGVLLKSFRCTKYLLDADAVINFCKLKTHGLVAYTGACKNLFGAIPGMKKSECHYLFPETLSFAGMLVDLYEAIHPRLCIGDAVWAMEGNGPSVGAPRKLGALLAAENGHALDLVGAALMNLSAKEAPTLAVAAERGLIPEDLHALNVAGDFERFIQKDFVRTPIRPIKSWGSGNLFITNLLENLLADKPRVQKSLCVGCGICGKRCPANAITFSGKLPVVDRKRCIRCFCCQEFCEAGAMRVNRPPLAKLIYR